LKGSTLTPFTKAISIIERGIPPVNRIEPVWIENALGRVLAHDFTVTINVPSYIRSLRDGFAVRSRDTLNCTNNNPQILKITDRIFAGDVPRTILKTGQCIQIATGAMLPREADAVIMLEDTEIYDKHIKVRQPINPGDNLGKVGEDVAGNTIALKAGAVISAGGIGILASQGKSKIEVYEKPRVVILPSGNEVRPLGKRLRKGQLYNTNAYTIAAIVKANGGEPLLFDIMSDRADVVRGTIAEAIKNDIVVISGGTSVGERDLIAAVVEGWGKILFHGVKVRPGKPSLFAIIEGTPLFGLPGYPAASIMSAYLLVIPALRRAAHLSATVGRTIIAPLAYTTKFKPGLRQFYTVKIQDGEVVLTAKESAAITSIANADGYIEIQERTTKLEKGEPVTVTLF
jgi:molybdopterin molybdotransferase